MNKNIINQFELLIKQIKLDINNTSGLESVKHSFRLNSIKNALKIIKEYPKKIKSSDDLKGIKGIGKGTLRRIDEILKTKKLKEIKITDSVKYLESIENLIKIFGIGQKKAHELVTQYNITNITDLKKLIKNKKIKLPDNIIKGLKYVNKTKFNIPRKYIDEIYLYLIKKALIYDSNLYVIICGSYRRLKPTSNDIDILIYHNNIKTKKGAQTSNIMTNFIKLLVTDKFIVDNYTSYNVPTKFMGLCKYKRKDLYRIDIRLIPLESIHPAMLYFTGSRDFNKKLRRIAMNLNYTLNEYGLFDSKNKVINVQSEKDIFDILGVEYLQPHQRI